jgi:hypothetical protein
VGAFYAYLPAARSLTWAAVGLGLPFAVGFSIAHVMLRRLARGTRDVGACAVALAVLALLFGFCHFLYPDLLFSGSAVRQTSPYLLTAGRVFPMYVLAALLGAAAAPAAARAPGRWIVLTAAGAAVLLCGIWSGSYRLPYGVACASSLLSVVLASLPAGSGGERRLTVPGFVAAIVAAVALVFALLADPHRGWMALRTQFALNVERAHGVRIGPEDVTVQRVEFGPCGIRAELAGGGVRGAYVMGSWAPVQPAVAELREAPDELAIALGLAFARRPGRVLVLGPGPERAIESAAVLSGPASGEENAGRAPGAVHAADVIVCGPGALSGCLSGVLGVGPLQRIRARLGEGGAFAMWFPVGSVSTSTLRRALATFGEVFPTYYVFSTGWEAVFVGSDAQAIEYARLEGLFGREDRRRTLEAAGVWGPFDVVGGFVASGAELIELSEGVKPYRRGVFSRSPVLARADPAQARASAAAALMQYRLAGPQRLFDLLRFDNPRQREVALHGMARTYQLQTALALQLTGQAGDRPTEEIERFVNGPLARLDLLGAGAEDRTVQLAEALAVFGLDRPAADLLQRALKEGRSDFELHRRLARRLLRLGETDAALLHYKKALHYNPNAADVKAIVFRLQDKSGMLPSEEAVPGGGGDG